MSVIKVKSLTKDYGHNRGVFDVSFEVRKGEVFGFLGPNGAGKTTTIRHIMGFSRPGAGTTSVEGLNSWEKHYDIQKSVGYLPGEIALPESLTRTQFIKMMAELRGMTDMTYIANDLRHNDNKEFKIEFSSKEDVERFREQVEYKSSTRGEPKKFNVVSVKRHRNQAKVAINDQDANALIAELSGYSLNFLTEIKFTLEDYFMKFYDRNTKVEGDMTNAVN